MTFVIWTFFTAMSILYNEKHEIRGILDSSSKEDDIDSEDPENDFMKLGIVKNNKDLQLREDGYGKHAFNLLISERLGLHRHIKDTRHEL